MGNVKFTVVFKSQQSDDYILQCLQMARSEIETMQKENGESYSDAELEVLDGENHNFVLKLTSVEQNRLPFETATTLARSEVVESEDITNFTQTRYCCGGQCYSKPCA